MTPPDSNAGIQDAARHLAESRPDEAAAVLERLVRDFPTYVTAHVLLAKAYEASGRVPDALEAWHGAYFLMPGSPLVARERARLLRADVHPVVLDKEDEPAEGLPDVEPEPPTSDAHDKLSETEPLETAGSAEAEEPEAKAEAVLGSEPEAWVSDVQPPPETEVADEPDDATGDGWAIVEETETPRTESPDLVEPAVAPPVGHGQARAAKPTAHDVPQPGRFVDEEAEGPTTEVAPDAAEEVPEADDLDALIQQLENAPRIRPDPEFQDDGSEPEEAEGSELVSETLARIYETQKQYDEAARTYEQLASQQPARATELLSKAAALRRAAGAGG